VDRAAVLKLFDDLTVWSSGDQRAPHKPLLILYALGRYRPGEPSEIPFAEVSRDLTELLKEFGPSRKSYHPEYPFWRLQNDGVWSSPPTGNPLPGRGTPTRRRVNSSPTTPPARSRPTY
jgi:putative restriction endonuclease